MHIEIHINLKGLQNTERTQGQAQTNMCGANQMNNLEFQIQKGRVYGQPTRPLLHVTFTRPSTASAMLVIFTLEYKFATSEFSPWFEKMPFPNSVGRLQLQRHCFPDCTSHITGLEITLIDSSWMTIFKKKQCNLIRV